MLKVSTFPTAVQGKTNPIRVQEVHIPRLNDIRRVPVRYHRIIPLSVMKRYQCAVVGKTSRMLTVGMTEGQNDALVHLLQVLTGLSVFPVFVEPERMRLLIAKIERHESFDRRYSQAYYTQMLPGHVRLLLACSQK